MTLLDEVHTASSSVFEIGTSCIIGRPTRVLLTTPASLEFVLASPGRYLSGMFVIICLADGLKVPCAVPNDWEENEK
jgi:hypothetical protein